jgi:hypothetical protein
VGFSDLPWSERERKLGDTSENAFELTLAAQGRTWVRLGQLHSEVAPSARPDWVRKAPDYLVDSALWEVKSSGHERKVRLAFAHYVVLRWWAELLPLYVFVWEMPAQRSFVYRWHDIQSMLSDQARIAWGEFSDGNAFLEWALP